MSRILILEYNNWSGYAGDTYVIKDQGGTQVATGTVDVSGCEAGIEVEVENDTTSIEWFIEGVKKMAKSIPTLDGGSGAYTVTVDCDGIVGANVTMRQGIDTVRGVTGVDGTVDLHPDNLGPYELVASKSGYEAVSRTETVVDGMTIDVELTMIVIVAPTDPTRCAPYGFFERPDGVPYEGLEFEFTLLTEDPINSGAMIAGRKVVVKTDENGEIGAGEENRIELARNDLAEPAGTKWRIFCEEACVDTEVTLDADTFDLNSLAA